MVKTVRPGGLDVMMKRHAVSLDPNKISLLDVKTRKIAEDERQLVLE